ncbi:MAG: peptidoglycan-binding domain-containing protein [Pseudomonadota bacterium]
MRRGVASFWAGLTAVAGGLLASTAALAGDEKKCSEQYSFEEHVILEWAALAGDPHAQFAIAQCAYPENAKNLTEAETIYALKWVTFAACDVDGGASTETRDRITRRLKSQGDLSFRRFSGVSDDERFSRREKRFQEYRDHKTGELKSRLKRLMKKTGDAEQTQARYELGDDLIRLGPLGALRLASLSECEHFGASDSFKAATWTVAANAWEDARGGGLYGAFDDETETLTSVASAKRQNLNGAQWDKFDYEKARFTKYAPARLAALEEDAALARLERLKGLAGPARIAAAQTATTDDDENALLQTVSLSSAVRSASEAFDGPAVTMATQYALEALGFMEFVNGPDNDYGPSTIEAVAKAQQAMGRQPTRWLSHGEARDMVCRAAVKAGDPVSYYHVGMMYKNGWGYTENLVKARYAMDIADRLMGDKLSDKSALPAWKARVYPEFDGQIQNARQEIETAWAALPAFDKNQMSAWNAKDGGLCN